MDKELKLITLRNDLFNTDTGNVLLTYLQDYLTEMAVKNCNSDEIRGMCKLIQQIKDIPSKV